MLSNQTGRKAMWINADLGEGCRHDEALFKVVDWANVACGGHTGDKYSIRVACTMALEHGVRVGAYPAYPQQTGFGGNKPDLPTAELLDELKRQVDLFENIAAQMHCVTAHFKPHGKLYNDAAFDTEAATLLIELAQQYPHLKLVALAESPLVNWAMSAGVFVVEEAFPDRAYLGTGALAPRSLPGAVIDDPEQVKAQAVSMIRQGPVMCLDGFSRVVHAQTLCVHGDTDQALANAQAVRQALIEHDQDTFSGAD